MGVVDLAPVFDVFVVGGVVGIIPGVEAREGGSGGGFEDLCV